MMVKTLVRSWLLYLFFAHMFAHLSYFGDLIYLHLCVQLFGMVDYIKINLISSVHLIHFTTLSLLCPSFFYRPEIWPSFVSIPTGISLTVTGKDLPGISYCTAGFWKCMHFIERDGMYFSVLVHSNVCFYFSHLCSALILILTADDDDEMSLLHLYCQQWIL